MLLAAVARWLKLPGLGARDPLETLTPLLASEGHEELFSPEALTLRPFLLNPQAPPVASLRARALDMAFAQLHAAEPRRVAAALATIGAALTGPLGGFGLQITEAQRAAWDAPLTATLTRLRDTLTGLVLTPVQYVALRGHLQWLAEYGAPPVRDAARAVFTTIPADVVNDLARALHCGPINPPTDPVAAGDYRARQQSLDALFAATIDALANRDDTSVLDLLDSCLTDLRELLGDGPGQARAFLFAIVTARPSLAHGSVALIETDPGRELAAHLAIMLIALAVREDPVTLTLAQRLLATGDTAVARQVAHAFGLQRSRPGTVLPGEDALLRALVAHDDPVVHGAALGAVRSLGPAHRQLAVDLLTMADPQKQGFALREAALLVGPHGPLSWHELPEPYKERFFAALLPASSLEDFETGELLVMLSHDEPERVLRLLTGRIEAIEAGGTPSGFSPLPHSWPHSLRFREHERFPQLLRALRAWLTQDPKTGWRAYLGSELFTAVVGSFDDQTRQVVEEYLGEPDPVKITAVAVMLRGAPREVVWDLPFVRRVLSAAAYCGPESLGAVQGALYSAMFAGGRWAAPGQPFPEDVAQEQAATALAVKCTPGSLEEQFYRALAESARRWIDLAVQEVGPASDGRSW